MIYNKPRQSLVDQAQVISISLSLRHFPWLMKLYQGTRVAVYHVTA